MSARAGARRTSHGSASLELVAMLPLLFVFASMAFQVAVDVFTTVSTQDAARTAARAASLGGSAAAAAQSALPGPLTPASLTVFGPTGHGVRLVVDAPRVSLLPTFTVTREVEFP